MSKKTSIYKTEQYPASTIFQNHLDVIHGLFDAYCTANKDCQWGILYDSKRIASDNSGVLRCMKKHEPDTLRYYVVNSKDESELILHVDNGVSISIKNGSYELYGLFSLLRDACGAMSAPRLLVLFRRYWVLSLLVAGMMIPMLIILLAGGGWWVLAWILFGGLIELYIVATLLESSNWGDYILSTKIHYNEFSTKTLDMVAAIFGSMRGTMSLLASLATVVTFFIFLVAR